MSAGMTPQDFVQQVYYTQEKVILDFWPSDDKYKEVIMEANLVLQELQKEEDWSWLRKEFKLGVTGNDHQNICNFDLSEIDENHEIYKPCSLFGDCVRLYRMDSDEERINDLDVIQIPFTSVGMRTSSHMREANAISMTNVMSLSPKAIYFNNTISFNRPFCGPELNRIAYMDIQQRLTPLHICNDSCVADEYETDEGTSTVPCYEPDNYHPCNQIEDVIFTQIPDPNYMVVRTAYKHAMGSPSAQGRIADLADDSQKLLSAMRQNDAMATDPDYLAWDSIGFIEVM